MQFRVYGPHDTARYHVLQLPVSHQTTLQALKDGLCSRLQVRSDAVELWDYWNNSKYERLEDYLDDDLEDMNIRDGQPLLLEAKIMKLNVKCSLYSGDLREVQIPATATVETLKDTCASEFGMHSGSFVLWDYYEWTKQCRLDDRLQQSLAAANIWQGQAVLLEERTLKLTVCCPCISGQQKFVSIRSNETVSSLKDKACAAFDVEQGSVVLWDYHGNRKYANLQDNMSRTLAEALVINKQAILLEAKVLKLNVYRQALDGTISRPTLIKKLASETVSSVKAAICTSFSLDPSSVVLWDFFNSTKHACLDAQLDSTLAAVRVIDKQALLVEVKPLPAWQQSITQLLAIPQPQQQQPAQQMQQLQPVQQQLQPSSSTQEQLLHALLEYVAAPQGVRSSGGETEDQIVELLTAALQLHSEASSTSTVGTRSQPDHRSTAIDRANSSDASEELQQLKHCVVCLDAPRSVMLLPCKHLALCSDCSEQLKDQARNNSDGAGPLRTPCPVCRVPAHQHLPGVILS